MTGGRPLRDALALWAEPGDLTDLGGRVTLPLRGDPVRHAVAVARALLRHDAVAESLHGHVPAPERADDLHVRDTAALVDLARTLDDAPLSVPRANGARVLGGCRTYAVLTVALLRSGGIPARARCGFAGFLVPGRWEDHWIVEHWSDAEGRWVRVDPQLDEVRRAHPDLPFDPMDLPPQAFVPAGRLWQDLRAGRADPAVCGLSSACEAGEWFVAGNVVRDLAALTKQELLPWDVWGAMPPSGPVDERTAVRVDAWAELSADPDGRFFDLLACVTDDEGVRVPDEVHNGLRHRKERWLP